MPEVWTPFHDLLIAALALFEGLLLPLVFYIADSTFREAIKRACCSCRRRRQSSKISSASNNGKKHNPALAFVDRTLLATPPYLKAPLPLAMPLSPTTMAPVSATTTSGPVRQGTLYQSRPASLALMASNYQSELDLSRRGKFQTSSLSIAQTSSFLDHTPNHKANPKVSYLKASEQSSYHHKPMGAASSMLDLSFKSNKASDSYPIGLPQYPPSAVASRTRHSLAILSHLHSSSGGASQLTPRSSIRRRPPSVASYHHLYGVNGTQHHHQRCPQYLFGGVPGAAKSETTLNMTPISQGHQSPSFKNPYFLRKIKETEAENELLTFKQYAGSSHNLSGHYNPARDTSLSPSPTKGLNRSSKAGSGIRDLFSGIAGGARSSFKRRSIRKCGSDASTFLSSRKSTPNNNKQRNSQLAHNQLSSILYNNFYAKKFGPTNANNFGNNNTNNYSSQSTLLTEIEPTVSGSKGSGGHLSSRHLSYDFGNVAHHQASSHVYLPNVTSPQHHRKSRYQQSDGSHHQLETRSASCAQLNQLNRADSPVGHYHNHLLNKQGLRLDSPKLRSSFDKTCGKFKCNLHMLP